MPRVHTDAVLTASPVLARLCRQHCWPVAGCRLARLLRATLLMALLIACAAPTPSAPTNAPTSVSAAVAAALVATATPLSTETPTPLPTATPTDEPSPTPEPTPAPTETPAPPEQPAGMIQFDGYTITYDAAKSQWVQKNEKGAVRTVWNETTGKWEIPASVKSIEIGPEGVDHGLVVALPVEEIKKLMEQQPGRIPLPIRLNDATKVKIEEGQSKSPLLRFYGMSGVSILSPVDGLYTKSNDGPGGGVIILRSSKQTERSQLCFPRIFENMLSPGDYTIGAVMFSYPLNNGVNPPQIKTVDSDLRGEFMLEGVWKNKQYMAIFEDLLTDDHGRLVIFRKIIS